MAVLPIMLTTAGLDALVDAQNAVTAPIEVVEVGLADAAFTAAPTLTALPHEFKRLDSIAGTSPSETIIHMTALDDSAESYTAYGFGLFLADGTLFGTYAQETPLVLKASIPKMLIAIDIGFLSAVDAAVLFGDTNFVFPPATETTRGVARIATTAKVTAATDDEDFVTALKLGQKIAQIIDDVNDQLTAQNAAVTAAINAALAKTVTGLGLLTGGGAISTNPALTAPAASRAEVTALASLLKIVTPDSLNGLFAIEVPAGGGFHCRIGPFILKRVDITVAADSAPTVTFPAAFPNGIIWADVAGGQTGTFSIDSNDPQTPPSTWSASGVGIHGANNTSAACSIFAIGY